MNSAVAPQYVVDQEPVHAAVAAVVAEALADRENVVLAQAEELLDIEPEGKRKYDYPRRELDTERRLRSSPLPKLSAHHGPSTS